MLIFFFLFILLRQDNKEDKESDEKTETEKQIDASAELMLKLVAEGDEVVS